MAKTKKRAVTPLIDLMFQAFSHRMRVRILHLLAQGEMCVCNIVEILQSPQPKVSRHLAVSRRRNSSRCAAKGSGSITHWLPYRVRSIRSFWSARLAALTRLRKYGKTNGGLQR